MLPLELPPTRLPGVPATDPIVPTLLPNTVTLAEPVAAAFVLVVELTSGASELHDDPTLLVLEIVATVVSSLDDPDDTRPRRLLPDVHSVLDDALPPVRTPPLYSPA